MPRTNRTVSHALPLALALLAIGCNGDDDFATQRPPAVSPSATARSPDPTATPPPATPTDEPAVTATSSLAPTPPPTPTPTPRGAPPTLEPLEVRADREWIRDAAGRVVLLRGANYSGLEFGNFIGRANGPAESDFAQMASWGFNVIRLPIAWSFLEPEAGVYDESYLTEQVDRIVDFADRHGILVILDMHQFQWSPCFTGGNGAPAWTCDDRGYSDDLTGYGEAGCDLFAAAAVAPDQRPLLDHFVDAWRMVLQRYAGDRRIAGFDFFNEPVAARCYPTSFERDLLNPLYRRLRALALEEGATQTFFYSPPLTRNLMLRVDTEDMGPNVVYAPHLYTQTLGLPDLLYNGDAATITADYEQAAREAEAIGGPLFSGEFGGNTAADGGFLASTELFLRHSLEEQDRRLAGGTMWAYFPSDNTFSVVDAEGNEKGGLVDVIARPFARRIAGTPTGMSFDADTGELFLSFVDAVAPDPTEIFLPLQRHYPNGATVETTPGDRFELREEGASARLLIFRGPARTHEVHIRPAPESRTRTLKAEG